MEESGTTQARYPGPSKCQLDYHSNSFFLTSQAFHGKTCYLFSNSIVHIQHQSNWHVSYHFYHTACKFWTISIYYLFLNSYFPLLIYCLYQYFFGETVIWEKSSKQGHGFIRSLNIPQTYMLLTSLVNVTSQKPAMKMLHGLLVNDRNYNIIFYPWWDSMCLNNGLFMIYQG